MRHEIKKISRIVDELTTLFLRKDTKEIDIKIRLEADRTVINIVDYGTHYDDAFIDKFCKTLNRQRQAEIEEYYWQLAGEIDQGDELLLISAMIDSARVEKKDGNLCIELVRLSE